MVQKRLVDNTPIPVDDATMEAVFRGAIAY
jgi:hypothetical protein